MAGVDPVECRGFNFGSVDSVRFHLFVRFVFFGFGPFRAGILLRVPGGEAGTAGRMSADQASDGFRTRCKAKAQAARRAFRRPSCRIRGRVRTVIPCFSWFGFVAG